MAICGTSRQPYRPQRKFSAALPAAKVLPRLDWYTSRSLWPITMAWVPATFDAQNVFASAYATLLAPAAPPRSGAATALIMYVPLPVSITSLLMAQPARTASSNAGMASLVILVVAPGSAERLLPRSHATSAQVARRDLIRMFLPSESEGFFWEATYNRAVLCLTLRRR